MLTSKGKRAVKAVSLLLALLLILGALCGCSSEGYKKNASLDTSKPVKLVIAGIQRDYPAMELVAQEFSKVYPNAKVEYEYLQAFDDTLPKRLTAETEKVDMFISENILSDSKYIDDIIDYNDYKNKVSFAETFAGLTENYQRTTADGVTHQYVVPMGGEMRGMYVNVTILKSLGIEVPQNRTELLAACEKLRDAGYIAIQDNPGSFGQRLMFPNIVHGIVSGGSAAKETVESASDDAAELFRDAFELIYTLNKENYYNYKKSETELNHFKDLSDEGMARSFLNIVETDNGYAKKDDMGDVPFMTAANTLISAIDKAKEDYHSNIEYKFILAPVADYGGDAYMSPTSGIAVSKHSENIDWALEFINFFYSANINKKYAEAFHCVPNTKDALEILGKSFGIPANQIGQPSDIDFSYNLFSVINPSLVTIAKANNPKYMKDDGNGGVVMYDMDYYMESLKNAFKAVREASESVVK